MTLISLSLLSGLPDAVGPSSVPENGGETESLLLLFAFRLCSLPWLRFRLPEGGTCLPYASTSPSLSPEPWDPSVVEGGGGGSLGTLRLAGGRGVSSLLSEEEEVYWSYSSVSATPADCLFLPPLTPGRAWVEDRALSCTEATGGGGA